MVDAFKVGRGVRVTLPPPAPLPRFSTLPPLPSLSIIDDTDPTRPFVPDPPTVPRTPPMSWTVPPIPWLDEAAHKARNAPTVRPPPPPPPSRVPAALHGFAAGLACGAIGLLVLRGIQSPPEPVPLGAQAASAGTVVGGVAAGRAATQTAPTAPAASSASPVIRAEDLPRFTTRVEDLPAAGPRTPVAAPRRGAWRGRTRP
jgi:hypothetical protein